MKRIKSEDIKIVIMNPERIPIAQEKLIDFVYKNYVSKAFEEKGEDKKN